MNHMTDGSILKGVIRFAVPCIISNVLQNLYNIVDSVIVGKSDGTAALAAVGFDQTEAGDAVAGIDSQDPHQMAPPVAMWNRYRMKQTITTTTPNRAAQTCHAGRGT